MWRHFLRVLLPSPSSLWHISTQKCPPRRGRKGFQREGGLGVLPLRSWMPMSKSTWTGIWPLPQKPWLSICCGSTEEKSCSCFGKWLQASGREWTAVSESQSWEGAHVQAQDGGSEGAAWDQLCPWHFSEPGMSDAKEESRVEFSSILPSRAT